MLIRELQYDDLPGLAQLYKQFWGEDSSPEKMSQTFERLSKNKDYIILVAIVDSNIVGSVMGIVCEELYGECQPFFVIEDVIVDKLHRRKKIGFTLMQSLENRAIDRGCSYCLFVTENNRADAHKFYASLGYDPDNYKGFKKRFTVTNHR